MSNATKAKMAPSDVPATRGEVVRLLNLAIDRYHARYHTPWYRRLWARIARREG